MQSSQTKPFLAALSGSVQSPPPIWLMRQAGRYLPEYRKTRQEAGSFLELCYNPDLATEVTLQPIRRYGFDASILFSDILVIPDALGQKVWFEEGLGPRLTPLTGEADLAELSADHLEERLAPVFQTLRQIKVALPQETALIGFAGAPWTVASYMIEGGSSRDFLKGKSWAYGKRALFQKLIDLLVEATSDYLSLQVEAGAEALQIFDSWAGVWPEDELRRWSLEPLTRIVANVKSQHPDIPIILFPRGAGLLYEDFARTSGCDGLSLDSLLPLAWARDHLQPHVTLQGNLDPAYLISGGQSLDLAVDHILTMLSAGPFIFNLGHGIDKSTPPEHVTRMVDRIRNRSA